MVFTLEVRRARKGDCLLLHCGTAAKAGLIIIDGGPKNVYGPQLKKRLERLSQSRKRPLPVDIVLVSHVDDDHIQGLLDLTREEIDRDDKHEPKLLSVGTLWHNSFLKLAAASTASLNTTLLDQFGAAALQGTIDLSPEKITEIEESFSEDFPEKSAEEMTDSLKVLASLEQGDRLHSDAQRLDWEINAQFKNELIFADPARGPFNLGNGLRVTVIGPLPSEVEALRRAHEKWVREQEKKKRTPAQAIAAYLDKSVTNLSSIVLLVEKGKKRMLLTGDARGDKIIQGLKDAGRFAADGTLAVDILKVPHHGSSNNLERSFFEQVVARHYVFSGDGEHGNPERETLEMLFNARGTSPLTIHFTYPVDVIDRNRELEWEKQRRLKEAKAKKAGGDNVDLPEEWSPEKQSLAAFFASTKLAEHQTLLIVDEAKDHKIDLLEPLQD